MKEGMLDGYEMFGDPCEFLHGGGCYWWESEDAQRAIWWANDAWQVGPKGDMGNHNEGDLKGMEGHINGCPHANHVTGASETWLPPLREQQWKYKKAVDEWTNNEGSFSWTLCPYLDWSIMLWSFHCFWWHLSWELMRINNKYSFEHTYYRSEKNRANKVSQHEVETTTLQNVI